VKGGQRSELGSPERYQKNAAQGLVANEERWYRRDDDGERHCLGDIQQVAGQGDHSLRCVDLEIADEIEPGKEVHKQKNLKLRWKGSQVQRDRSESKRVSGVEGQKE
jgi:hypothetical protein